MNFKLIFSVFVLNFFLSCKSEPKKDADIKNEMSDLTDNIKSEKGQTKPKENPYKDAKLDIKVFNNDSLKKDPGLSGFGYDIYMFDALYVHQPHIPAINGSRGFHTHAQAQKAGEFILYKIRNNIMPPAVSPRELDSLGVLK